MFRKAISWIALIGILLSGQCFAAEKKAFVIWMTYEETSMDSAQKLAEDTLWRLDVPIEPQPFETAVPRLYQAVIMATDGSRVFDVPLGINSYLAKGEDGTPIWVEVDLEGENPRVSLSQMDSENIHDLWNVNASLEPIEKEIAIPNLDTVLRYMDGKIYYFALETATSAPGLYAIDVETREIAPVVATRWDEIYAGELSSSGIHAFGEGILIGSNVWIVKNGGNWVPLADDLAQEYDGFSEQVAWLSEEVLLFWGYKRSDPDKYGNPTYTLLYANIQTGESGAFLSSEGSLIQFNWERPFGTMTVASDGTKILLGLEHDEYYTFDRRYYWLASINLTDGKIDYLAPVSRVGLTSPHLDLITVDIPLS